MPGIFTRRVHSKPSALAWAGLAVLASCGPVATAGPGCSPAAGPISLGDDLAGASGVVVSLQHPGVFWTHDDHGSALFAVDDTGAILAKIPVRPRLRDWEDLGLSTCPQGGSCLYLADLGDNYEERTDVRIGRIPEPDPAHPPARLDLEVFPVRLPDGPRDVEALLVLPGERVLAVSKGRNDPVTVYRYPGRLRPDTVTLEEVQRLTDSPPFLPRQVTGGAVSPKGDFVALRTYETLRFYRVQADTLIPMEDGLVNLRSVREAQGEGVGIGRDGQVVLTSEGGPLGGPGGMHLLRCRLPDDD